jgi:TonB family protein
MPVEFAVMVEAVAKATGPASAPSAAPAPVIVRPTLVEPPDMALLYKNYPAKALADRLDGSAVLHCRVLATGQATECLADQADPAGFGFDAAALAIVPSLKLSPQTVDGKPVNAGRFNVRIRFSAPPEPPVFLKRATQRDIQGAWPSAAFAKGVRGSASLVCDVNARGMMERCEVERETPPGMGFGAAGIALTPQFLVKPAIKNGVPVPVSGFQMTIRWDDPTDGGNTGTHLKGSQAQSYKVYSVAPWTTVPTRADIARAFPAKVLADKTGGRVTQRCTISATGALSSCDVVAIQPRGMGFDAAARTLIKAFRTDVTADGVDLVRSKVDVTIDFDPALLDPAMQADGFEITGPQAVTTVTAKTIEAAFPAVARSAGLKTGRALVECLVGLDGRMKDCKVALQTPDQMGFGAAALGLAGQIRLVAWSQTGNTLAGGKMRLPFVFVLP